MAYCPSILNHPQYTELKVCWCAGTMTEKSFKAYYKSVTVNKINIAKICEEIEKICNRDKSRKKLNLYLSSQLMHGVIKLHSYQTKYLEKDVFQMQYKLNSLMLEEIDLENEDDERELPDHPIDMFLMEENAAHLNRNLLTDYDLEARELQRRVEVMYPNFGTLNSLTSEELNLTPRHVEHTISNLERRLQDIHCTQETEDEEVYQERQSSQASASVALIDVSKIKELGTPKKRVPETQPHVETPTKRRRLSFPDALAAPLIEEQTVEKTAAPIIPEQVEIQSLDSVPPIQSLDLPQTPRFFATQKPKKIMDKKTVVDKHIIQKWYQDIHFKCRESDLMPKHRLTPAKDLLMQPLCRSKKKWAANLCNLFERHITGAFKSNVDQHLFPPTEELQTEEVLPVEEATSRLNLPTEVSAFGKDATADSAALASIRNIMMDHLTDQHLAVADEASAMQPDISQPDSLHETVLTPSLTSQDILDKLQVLWHEKEYIKFNKLLPDPCSRMDITTIFFVLLQLYADAKIVLMQKDCHDILWIRKHFAYD